MGISPPAVRETISDGGLGIVPVSGAGAQFKIGVCSLGTPNTVYNLSDANLIASALGVGPLVESAIYHLNKSGGATTYLIPVTASVAGVAGSVTKSNGSGPTVTVAGAPNDGYSVKLTIGTAGSVGVGSFTFSLDGGDSTSAPYVLPPASTFVLPNTNMTITFPVGAQSAVVNVGGGPAVTIAGTPTTLSNVVITITTGGVLGTSFFTYAINGGAASTPQATPVGGTFLVPGTGITATFAAGTYILAATYTWTITATNYTSGDTYTFSCTAPGFSTSDAGAALTAMLASPLAAEGVHVVGRPATAAGCASLAATVDSALVTAAGQYVYMWGMVESPDEAAANDTQIAAAFASFSSLRTFVAAGTEQLLSDVNPGRDARRSSAWVVAPRIAAVPISQDIAWVGAPQGGISGINTGSGGVAGGLYRDERATPGLDALRFITLRTFVRYPGIFITKGRTMAPPGSDFSLVQYRRVMDAMAGLAYRGFLPFLNFNVAVDKKTGFIDDAAASAIEAVVNSLFQAELVTPGHLTLATVRVGRTNPILSDQTLNAQIRGVPKGSPTLIQLGLAFMNPAILLAAA